MVIARFWQADKWQLSEIFEFSILQTAKYSVLMDKLHALNPKIAKFDLQVCRIKQISLFNQHVLLKKQWIRLDNFAEDKMVEDVPLWINQTDGNLLM